MRSLLALFAIFCLAAPDSPAQEIRLAVTDIVGLEELQREYGRFAEALGTRSGFKITFLPVTSRVAAVEALRFKQVDFVLTGPAEYVVFRKRTDAVPVVGFVRPDYFAAIIVKADSGINSVAQLKGKKVGFAETGSTSGHLAPMQLLKDNGLDPIKDIEPLHLKRKVAWEAFKRGDLAAWGENYQKFTDLRNKEADAGGPSAGAYRVIARGPDLPNDILLAGGHVDAAVIGKLRHAFVSYSGELIAAILTGQETVKYKGMAFIPAPADSEYDYVRSMYRTIGYPEFAEFLGH